VKPEYLEHKLQRILNVKIESPLKQTAVLHCEKWRLNIVESCI